MSGAECLIGSYSERTQESILRIRVDFQKGTFTKISGFAGLDNPSYLALDPKKNLLYAVEETAPEGSLAMLRLNGDKFELLSETTTKASDPAHVSLDKRGEFLCVANYSAQSDGGGIALYALNEAGMPDLCQIKRHQGHGPNAERQASPHPHFSAFTDDRVLVCDLGTDTLYVYQLDIENRQLKPTGEDLHFPPGSGPRHLCFSPKSTDWIYVDAELDGYVRVFHREYGNYELKQEIDSLPEGTSQKKREMNRTGAIKITDDGSYLLVTNRGEDSVSLFSVAEDHLLSLLDIQKTGSLDPRELTLFGDDLLIGHQEGKCITSMHLDRENEKLKVSDMVLDMGVSPVCILNLEEQRKHS